MTVSTSLSRAPFSAHFARRRTYNVRLVSNHPPSSSPRGASAYSYPRTLRGSVTRTCGPQSCLFSSVHALAASSQYSSASFSYSSLSPSSAHSETIHLPRTRICTFTLTHLLLGVADYDGCEQQCVYTARAMRHSHYPLYLRSLSLALAASHSGCIQRLRFTSTSSSRSPALVPDLRTKRQRQKSVFSSLIKSFVASLRPHTYTVQTGVAT